MADDIHTICEMLRYRSENDGRKDVFSFYDKNGLVSTLNPHEIYTLAGKFAYCLKEWGFQQEDVIASGLPNSHERVISDFGVIMAGCVLSNFQVIEKDGSDFWNTTKMSKCQGLIVINRKDNPAYKLISRFLPDNSFNSGVYNVSIQQAPSIKRVILVDRKQGDRQNSLLDILKDMDMSNTFHANCNPSSLALLFGTSGSSGFSKLIPESHENILDAGRKFRASESALVFTDRPMGWIGGFPFEFLAFCGRRVMQDQFDHQHSHDPQVLWNIISTSGCTGAGLLPGAVYELVDCFRNSPPEHKLQFIVSSGQAMRRELMDAIGLLCHAIVVSYGSTEGGIFASDAITSPSQFKDFYAGKVIPDVQMKIVNEEGNELNHGEEGEIYIKCKRLVKHYFNQTTANTSSNPSESTDSNIYTENGWFKTGDRGILHADNSLYCFGRKGDVVSIGPTIVYLSWPESILNKCPNIQNGSIVGIEDDHNGNVKLCACVIPRAGSGDFSESVVAKFFDDAMMDTGFKFRLKLDHVFPMEHLPLLPTGKVHKRQLKKFVTEELKGL